MHIIVEKSLRTLRVMEGDTAVFACRIALGRMPEGRKQAEGDGKTPEGSYRICLVKEQGKYGRSLGLSYPGAGDAQAAFAQGRIDARTLQVIETAQLENRRPPWGSPLGGEIYIHEGGSGHDWTQGCIALDEKDMDMLFPLRDQIETVQIFA